MISIGCAIDGLAAHNEAMRFIVPTARRARKRLCTTTLIWSKILQIEFLASQESAKGHLFTINLNREDVVNLTWLLNRIDERRLERAEKKGKAVSIISSRVVVSILVASRRSRSHATVRNL